MSTQSTSQSTETWLLAKFNKLIAKGLVIFDENYRTVMCTDQELTFEFRILNSHAKKPLAPVNPQQHAAAQHQGCRPGSDIDVTGYDVASIGDTHFLTINKFPSVRPHYLILTKNGFRRQFEPLDFDDITAVGRVISSFTTRHLAIFNCGIKGGCSRLHKHMQVFAAPEKFQLWPDGEVHKLPFKVFKRQFRNGLPPAQELLTAYQELLREAARALRINPPAEGQPAVPHNVVLDKKWIVVIPRRSDKWEGVIANAANAAGMLGMVWVGSDKEVNNWLERGPTTVLTHLGVPNKLSKGRFKPKD
ncbi:uncharacterized protein C8A04DRAFT_29163 [Dichotomopilus funicola]|uniref:Ap4A phosphorylase II n=1 Tax=Dichotomopilus funicola TaxID=1934379 RepID=A0AAN6V411_9PEZI|nr:hypothetical protein C8A04DRAFT_29163 [Dichotomopilus funicola]